MCNNEENYGIFGAVRDTRWDDRWEGRVEKRCNGLG